MKRIQGRNVVGYVTIHVNGANPEFLFQVCANERIPVWDIKKSQSNECSGKIYVHHVKRVKMLAHNYSYDITMSNSKGYMSSLVRLWTKKEIFVSIILCSIIIFVMSNIVWKVNISGVSIEVENKIHKELTSYGLYEGGWAYSLESLDVIQQNVLNTTPELLYIGIQRKGTTYYVDAVEKLTVSEPEQLPNQHLVAKKNGIIHEIFVKKGLPVVQINDFVNKGDLLVSGIIEIKNDQTENDKEDMDREIVAADGKVYANTWYELSVTSSLHHSYERLTGDKETKYYVEIGQLQIPIWGFWNNKFRESSYTEVDKQPIYIGKWETPVQSIRKDIYNKKSYNENIAIEEAKDIAINHVKEDLQLKFGKDVQLLKYYILHETVDNGKVNLNLYVSLLENIASGNPIQ